MTLTLEGQRILRARLAEIKAETRALESETDRINRALAQLDLINPAQPAAPPARQHTAPSNTNDAKPRAAHAKRVPVGPDVERIVEYLRAHGVTKRTALRDMNGFTDQRIAAVLAKAEAQQKVTRIVRTEGNSKRSITFYDLGPAAMPVTNPPGPDVEQPGYRPPALPALGAEGNGVPPEPVTAGSGFGQAT